MTDAPRRLLDVGSVIVMDLEGAPPDAARIVAPGEPMALLRWPARSKARLYLRGPSVILADATRRWTVIGLRPALELAGTVPESRRVQLIAGDRLVSRLTGAEAIVRDVRETLRPAQTGRPRVDLYDPLPQLQCCQVRLNLAGFDVVRTRLQVAREFLPVEPPAWRLLSATRAPFHLPEELARWLEPRGSSR